MEHRSIDIIAIGGIRLSDDGLPHQAVNRDIEQLRILCDLTSNGLKKSNPLDKRFNIMGFFNHLNRYSVSDFDTTALLFQNISIVTSTS
jgi:hypothetical protein